MPVGASKLEAYAHLALAMATVGSIFPASKVIAAGLPPFVAGAIRLAVAAAVLLPWAAARQPSALRTRFDRHDATLLALQAAAGTVGFTVLMLTGTARTSASDASVVAGSLPAVAALVSMLLFRERPGARRTVAIALAVCGVAAVNVPSMSRGGPGPGRLVGNLLVLGAVASESLFILLNKRLHQPLPALAQSAVMTALGLAYLLPAALVEAASLDLGALSVATWLAVAYYGLVPTVLGNIWWYKGAEKVSGAEAGVFTAVMPLSGAALSALVLGERLGLEHGIGLVLVLAAIALAASERGGEPAGRPRTDVTNAAGIQAP